MKTPYLLHPDIETMDEVVVLFPGQRVKWKGFWAIVLNEDCPTCGHVSSPHPPFIRCVEGKDKDRRRCLCCGWVDRDN
jgi:hypothetical protein